MVEVAKNFLDPNSRKRHDFDLGTFFEKLSVRAAKRSLRATKQFNRTLDRRGIQALSFYFIPSKNV